MTRSSVSHTLCPLLVLVLVLSIGAARGQINVPSDGSDGVLDPSLDPSVCVGGALQNGICTIDLGRAATAAWDMPSPNPGRGVYDPAKWAVVFKYQSVNIRSGVTVIFKNHRTRAPVVWLVHDTATIGGAVLLNGSDGASSTTVTLAEPGPGGFRGGQEGTDLVMGGSGFGPGGGGGIYSGGSYAELGNGTHVGPKYGNDQIQPLIGGSGGSGSPYQSFVPGGAGGGAILIAADQTIAVNGVVEARGGASGGGGSGGAIRLITDTVSGSGHLEARSFTGGGAGRIRIEANTIISSFPSTDPAYRYDPPCMGANCTPQIWPPEGAPTVKITHVGGMPVPTDPTGRFEIPGHDLSIANPNALEVLIETQNVPTSWNVVLRATTPSGGGALPLYKTANATNPSCNGPLCTWTASITLDGGFTALQVRASAP